MSSAGQPIRRNMIVQRWGTPAATVGSVNEPRERSENGVAFNEKWLYRVPGHGAEPGYERIVTHLFHRNGPVRTFRTAWRAACKRVGLAAQAARDGTTSKALWKTMSKEDRRAFKGLQRIPHDPEQRRFGRDGNRLLTAVNAEGDVGHGCPVMGVWNCSPWYSSKRKRGRKAEFGARIWDFRLGPAGYCGADQLLQLRQSLRRKLSGFVGRIFFFDLLVYFFRLEWLVGILIDLG